MTSIATNPYIARLADTLPRVRDQIARAEVASGRAEGVVRLVAVTKSHPFEAVEAAIGSGLSDLGENRVEELTSKTTHFGMDAATWHMIGHVQSRKAKGLVGVAHVVHSVDSLKLAQRLSRAADEEGMTMNVLAQVNTSGEESKSGFVPASAADEIMNMAELPALHVNGLMTMAPFVDDEVVLGRAFESLRRLLETLRAGSSSVGEELSMGMTNDLEIAIREGSTMVRIGTALFGPREK